MISKRNIKIRIIDKKRFTAFVSLVFMILSMITITFTGQMQASGQSVNNYAFVHVVEGDTLWDIANEYNFDNDDVRKVIHDIMNENNMNTAMLYQGQIIKVPLK